MLSLAAILQITDEDPELIHCEEAGHWSIFVPLAVGTIFTAPAQRSRRRQKLRAWAFQSEKPGLNLGLPLAV